MLNSAEAVRARSLYFNAFFRVFWIPRRSAHTWDRARTSESLLSVSRPARRECHKRQLPFMKSSCISISGCASCRKCFPQQARRMQLFQSQLWLQLPWIPETFPHWNSAFVVANETFDDFRFPARISLNSNFHALADCAKRLPPRARGNRVVELSRFFTQRPRLLCRFNSA